MENNKMKFIRKNGKIIPIKTDGLKSKQRSKVTYSDGLGKSGNDPKRVKETGRSYRSNLGHRDAISQLVHLKGSARKNFKAGIKQDINDGIRKGKASQKFGSGMMTLGVAGALAGLFAKRSDLLKGGVGLAGLGGIQKGLGNFMVKSEKKSKRNLDKDIKESSKEWDKWYKKGSSV